jgi:fructose-1,6-bisphosphatase/inositol monophosphatase family enzyme
VPAIPSHPLLEPIRRLHRRIRDDVVRACEEAAAEETLSRVAREDEADTIYGVDRIAEEVLVEAVADTMASAREPLLLIAEGLPGGEVLVPAGASRADVRWVVIVDPIDGTRGLMYQKRPAWILTGVARGPGPCTLADIELAVQTEIPLVKQHLSDQLWAVHGQGAWAERVNRLDNVSTPLSLTPSRATTTAHGFATVARFFPGNREVLAAIDDEIVRTVLGPATPGRAQLFEDQYISSAGQLYELMAGHDRFVADLRAIVDRGPRQAPPLCCHPYDLCTELIARELGVEVTDLHGRRLTAALDVTSDVGWVGYANAAIRALVEPALQAALAQRGLI